MKRNKSTETDEIENSTKSESLIANAPCRKSGHEVQKSSSASVTSEEAVRQIRALNYRLTQLLAHLCKLMRELRNEQANRRHGETASSRAASWTSGSGSRSDSVEVQLFKLFGLFQCTKSVWDQQTSITKTWSEKEFLRAKVFHAKSFGIFFVLAAWHLPKKFPQRRIPKIFQQTISPDNI